MDSFDCPAAPLETEEIQCEDCGQTYVLEVGAEDTHKCPTYDPPDYTELVENAAIGYGIRRI